MPASLNPVLMLDVDGVLCTARSAAVFGLRRGVWFGWDPVAVEAVKMACRLGPRIVITSTWRLPDNEPDLVEQLNNHGLSEFLHNDWKTEDLAESTRQGEIQKWLDLHPEVKSYRILDDIDIFDKPMVDKLILTDPDEGMSTENIRRLINWAKSK